MLKPFFILPQSIVSQGMEYSIRTDFRVWIDISNVFSNEDISQKDKLYYLIAKAIKDGTPQNPYDAAAKLLEFMAMGKLTQRANKKNDELISFEEDEGLIYAAFLQQYSIDLYEVDMHWWKFLSLLSSLDENTLIMKIASYRGANCEGIKNPELKRFIRRMKNRYRIRKHFCDEHIANELEMIDYRREK